MNLTWFDDILLNVKCQISSSFSNAWTWLLINGMASCSVCSKNCFKTTSALKASLKLTILTTTWWSTQASSSLFFIAYFFFFIIVFLKPKCTYIHHTFIYLFLSHIKTFNSSWFTLVLAKVKFVEVFIRSQWSSCSGFVGWFSKQTMTTLILCEDLLLITWYQLLRDTSWMMYFM